MLVDLAQQDIIQFRLTRTSERICGITANYGDLQRVLQSANYEALATRKLSASAYSRLEGLHTHATSLK